jgi:hypothetical protein
MILLDEQFVPVNDVASFFLGKKSERLEGERHGMVTGREYDWLFSCRPLLHASESTPS